ncbi:MAG: PD40 domain-containing protein, partial [Phycisphaerales bacterium]
MKWLNGFRMRFVFIGFVAAIVLGGGQRAIGDFVIGDAVLMDEAINHPSSRGIEGGSLSHDGLRFYFAMERDGGYGGRDIWVCERESPDAHWGEAVNLGPNVNGPASETEPEISHDELELYFWAGVGCRSTRASKDEPWGPRTAYNGFYPDDFSSDGLTMYFTDRWSLPGYGEGDIWMLKRASTDDDWGDPINLGPNVNDERRQGNACISHDELALFFNEDDALLMKMSVRRSRDSDWGPAVDISATLCPEDHKRYIPELSPDGRVLYFFRTVAGAFAERKFCQAPITPIVDFDGDGIVGLREFSKLAQYWGQNEPSVDIGPMPWGNGIVDVQDLAVLAENWLVDYRLIAH